MKTRNTLGKSQPSNTQITSTQRGSRSRGQQHSRQRGNASQSTSLTTGNSQVTGPQAHSSNSNNQQGYSPDSLTPVTEASQALPLNSDNHRAPPPNSNNHRDHPPNSLPPVADTIRAPLPNLNSSSGREIPSSAPPSLPQQSHLPPPNSQTVSANSFNQTNRTNIEDEGGTERQDGVGNDYNYVNTDDGEHSFREGYSPTEISLTASRVGQIVVSLVIDFQEVYVNQEPNREPVTKGLTTLSRYRMGIRTLVVAGGNNIEKSRRWIYHQRMTSSDLKSGTYSGVRFNTKILILWIRTSY